MKHLLLVAAVLSLLAGARVQDPPKSTAPSFRAEYLSGLSDVESKLTALAEAIPADKYAWRPAPGVRSISEVLMHVAGSNYFLLTFVGKQPPAGLPEDLEKITEKRQVLRELRKSFEHVRAAANALDEAELAKSVRMFGNMTTYRGVWTTVVNHLHEHLGQSVAYARMNGVAPPWSD